jgi:hypothetical protein
MWIALTVVALLLVLNIFASRAVRKGSDLPFKQNMLVAIIWVLPFVGVLMAWHNTGPGTVDVPKGTHMPMAGVLDAPAPAFLPGDAGPDFDVHAHLSGPHGFPLMDAHALQQWCSAAPSVSGAEAAMLAGTRAWLLHLREACGESFRLYETDDAFILSPLDNRSLSATAAFITTTRKRIATLLKGVAVFQAVDKSVLVVLHDDDAYYDYLSAYYPDEGEFSFSSGVFLDAGIPHFVVKLADLAVIEPVIAHEMTHSALAHLGLPRWLDEGLAVNTEQRLTGVPRLIYTPQELHAKHLRYWGAAEMAQFWSGDAFFRTDDGNLLSYELARILVGHLSADWERFSKFITAAERADAGAQAARTHLDVNLGVLVCALLEQPHTPDWEPALVTLEEVA